MPEQTNRSLDEWVRNFPREDARRRVEELENELASVKAALAMVEAIDGGPQRGSHSDGAPTMGEPETKPQAILTIMREHPQRSWQASTIANEMVARGWLAKSATHRKRFYATLSRMADPEDGRLLRPRKGFYELASPTLEAAPGLVTGEGPG